MPAAYAHSTKLKASRISSRKGTTVLKHKGLVLSLSGVTTYGATALQVNPGMANVFPWASRLARSYDKYRFRKLSFHYRPVCATTQVGVVMMSFDYDTLDAVPVSKYEQAQTVPNIETNAFLQSDLIVQCDDTWRYTRQGAVANTDLKTYDLGQLVISSAYSTANMIGELYVEYEVELDKPSHGVALTTRITTSSVSNPFPFTGTVVVAGTAQSWSINSNQGLTCNTAGEYVFSETITGTVITAMLAPSITSTTGGLCTIAVAGVIDAAQTHGTITYRVRASVGDILGFSNKNTVTTQTGATYVIAEAEYAALA